MKLLIERTATYIRQRYSLLHRDFDTVGVYDQPKTLDLLENILNKIKEPDNDLVTEPVIKHMEQDYRVPGNMENKTPQFFLRNLPRVRRTEEDEDTLPFEDKEIQSIPILDPKELVNLERPRFINQWSINDFKWLQAVIAKTLHHEEWTQRFSREIKESLMRGLWTSDPDPIDIHRRPFWEKETQ